MKTEDFVRSLEQYGRKSLRRPVLFYGEEEYWVQTGIDALKRLLFTAEDEDSNCIDLELKSVERVTLMEWLCNPPFFGANRLVILRGLEEVKANLETTFLNLLPNIAAGVHIVLTARHLDRRKKFIKELLPMVETSECPVLRVYEARKWINQEASKLGLKFSAEQINLLLEVKGVSLMSLSNELIKLRTFLGEDKRMVSMEEWSSLLGEASTSNIFAMTDGIFENKPGNALQQLRRILEAGEPEFRVLALLGGEVRRLLMAWDLMKQGRGATLQKELGCHPYVAEKLRKRAQTVEYHQLRQAHRRIIEADYRMKTGAGDPQLELEMTLLSLCSIFSPGKGATNKITR